MGEETVYTKHQNLQQTSKHNKQSALHSSVTRKGWGTRRGRHPRRYPGPSRSHLPPPDRRSRGLPGGPTIQSSRNLTSRHSRSSPGTGAGYGGEPAPTAINARHEYLWLLVGFIR